MKTLAPSSSKILYLVTTL